MKIDKDKQIGEINLSSAHTLVLGHKPDKLTHEDLSAKLLDKPDNELLSFGLFEVATPNYSTYYPDVTEDDLNPKEVEFIKPLFRMLSETIVSKYRPIDFSKKGVLRKSMQMLVGQTINIDHEIAVGNAIGAISEVFWQGAYKSKDGVQIPAGINAVMKIDGKSNPRIARGIMMDPPSIHSNSVTVRFKWEPSHTFEDSSEFYNRLGTYNDKGELIRLIVTEIISYHETSLVSHGADPYAQKIKENGEINDPAYADRSQSFSADKPIKGHFTLDYKTDLTKLSADRSIPENNNNNNNKDQNMDKLIKDLTKELGFEDGVLTKDNLVEKVKETLTAKDTAVSTANSEKDTAENSLAEVQGKLDTAEGDLANLQTQFDTLSRDKGTVDTVIKNTRDEATRLYKLCKGDNAEDTIINLIGTSNLDTASSFVRQYQKEVEEKFSATCDDCNSTNISRQTAKTSKDGLVNDDGKVDEPKDTKSSSQVIKSFKAKNKRKSRLFKDETEKK